MHADLQVFDHPNILAFTADDFFSCGTTGYWHNHIKVVATEPVAW